MTAASTDEGRGTRGAPISLFAVALLLDLPLIVAAAFVGGFDVPAYAAHALVGLFRDLSFVDLEPSQLWEWASVVAVACAIAGGVVAWIAVRRETSGAGWLLGGTPFFIGLAVTLTFVLFVVGFASFTGF